MSGMYFKQEENSFQGCIIYGCRLCDPGNLKDITLTDMFFSSEGASHISPGCNPTAFL